MRHTRDGESNERQNRRRRQPGAVRPHALQHWAWRVCRRRSRLVVALVVPGIIGAERPDMAFRIAARVAAAAVLEGRNGAHDLCARILGARAMRLDILDEEIAGLPGETAGLYRHLDRLELGRRLVG